MSNRAPRPCQVCGTTFDPKQDRSRWCSKTCENRLLQSAKPACSVDGCQTKSVARGLCRKHHPKGKTWSRGLPESRRIIARKRTQQRRAAIRDPEAELIDRDAVGDRDGWRCGLCHEKVDRRLAYPHPRSASLDHIEPLALGGKHILTNVQIAHLTCNHAKGARGGGEQLLLIG